MTHPESPKFTQTPDSHTPDYSDLTPEAIEILESDTAKSILPYLTLDLISKKEQADILKLADSLDFSYPSKDPPLHVYNKLKHEVATLVGEDEQYKKNDIITKKHSEARKLFCATLLDKYNHGDKLERWTIHEELFSSIPSFCSCCGDLKSYLELLSIAERSNNNTCASEIYDETVYACSSSDYNPFKKILADKDISPLKQLQLLSALRVVANHCDPDDYSRKAFKRIEEAFTTLSEKEESTPLVRILAKSYSKEIYSSFNTKWMPIEEDDPKYAELLKNHEQKKQRFKFEQEMLHFDFFTLPEDHFLTMVAPGIAATITKNGLIGIFSDQYGERTVSALDYSSNNSMGISQENVSLLSYAHSPLIKPSIEEKLNLKLSEIPLESQVQLLKFMTEANNDRFDNLTKTLHSIENEDLSKTLLENFVAVDFGEDFGDSLLSIAGSEKLNDQEKLDIFEKINSCRKSIESITSLYSDFDNGEFKKQYSRAANERLTDIITVFRETSENGAASADLEKFGKSTFSLNDALEALEYERKSLEIISGTLSAVRNGEEGTFAEQILHPDEYQWRSMYSFYSKKYGYVLLYTRPEGSSTYDRDYEYGNKSGIEASISFIANPVDPFSLPNPYRPDKKVVNNPSSYDPSTMNKISAIRLDREGRTLDMAPNDPNRSPINKFGSVSVDLAAIGDRADTPSGKIARLISVGSRLRNSSSSLNHNTNWFDQDTYGDADGFKALVKFVDSFARSLCHSRPPKKNEGFIGEKNRKFGKKIISSSEYTKKPAA